MSSKPVIIKKEQQDVKTEPSFSNASGSSQDVKMEVDEDEEEDVFEDSLDLDTSKAGNKVWLVRLPKFLMEKWHNPDNLHGQELGHVRIYSDDSNLPSDQQKVKVKLILNNSPENSDIPHEYDVSLQKHADSSTYVFTEKDMPKYDKKRAQQEAAKKEQQRLQQQQQRKGKFQFNKDRFVPYVKTIPSMRKKKKKPQIKNFLIFIFLT